MIVVSSLKIEPAREFRGAQRGTWPSSGWVPQDGEWPDEEQNEGQHGRALGGPCATTLKPKVVEPKIERH
jgi:hypothetical protein